MSSYVRQSPLTLSPQAYFLSTTFRCGIVIEKRNELQCVFELRPTSTSDSYKVDLRYRVPNRPVVRVISPLLQLAAGCTKLPHVFSSGELCLYTGGEWRPDLPIATFVVPWISEWLPFTRIGLSLANGWVVAMNLLAMQNHESIQNFVHRRWRD